MIVEPNLENSIYSLSVDVKNAIQGKTTKRIEKNKVLFILIDGLGYSLAEKVGIKAEKIHSVFPTITVTVLTTIFTATPPGVHGIMGWRIFDREKGRILNLLEDHVEMPKMNTYLSEKDVIVAPALRPSMRLFKSVGSRIIPYFSPWDAVTQTYEVAKRDEPNFIFLYLPFVDATSHHFGPNSPHTMRVAREVYSLAENLARDLSDKYSTVITADHGHVEVEGIVNIGKDILDVSVLPPYGDHRNLMFISKKDMREHLSKYGLLTCDREKLIKLTGGENVPDYAGVPEDNKLYMYWDDEEKYHKGSHGGMSKEEIEIPLVLIQ